MLIGYAGGGTRNIFANKPVKNMAEMKGLKVRVQGAPIWTKTFAAAGMAPTVIAYNEVYNAIQNGVIAAGENEAAGVEQMKFFEVAPSLNMTQHAITIRPIVLFDQDVQQAAERSAGRDHQGGQGSGRLRPPDRIQRGHGQARRAGEGGKLKRIPFADRAAMKKAGRPGDGRVRQGNRRRAVPGEDQRAVSQSRSRTATPGWERRGGFFVARSHAMSLWRKFTAGYSWLLSWLLVLSVAILIIPVSACRSSRATPR